MTDTDEPPQFTRSSSPAFIRSRKKSDKLKKKCLQDKYRQSNSIHENLLDELSKKLIANEPEVEDGNESELEPSTEPLLETCRTSEMGNSREIKGDSSSEAEEVTSEGPQGEVEEQLPDESLERLPDDSLDNLSSESNRGARESIETENENEKEKGNENENETESEAERGEPHWVSGGTDDSGEGSATHSLCVKLLTGFEHLPKFDLNEDSQDESTDLAQRELCCRCAFSDEGIAEADCTFIHPNGGIYQHLDPNHPVLPCTLSSPKKVSEKDCRWFHSFYSKSGAGVDIVLKCLNWPYSLSPDFVEVAIELLDYCLLDDAEVWRTIPHAEKSISEIERERSMILMFDEIWTKVGNTSNLKCHLPKLSFIFLKFIFNSDGKLPEAVVTLKKILEDDSSKYLDKEQFALQFCEKLDKVEVRRNGKWEGDSLDGKIKLMCKLATLFGHEIAEKHFLPRYLNFTSHEQGEVRKLCVDKIHEMVFAISESAVESSLLHAFLKLCHDKEADVTSSCLLGIIAVSSKSPMKLRISVLAPVFYKLLESHNALNEESTFLMFFPSFCPFVTTLDHLPLAALELNHECDVVLSYLNGSEFRFDIQFFSFGVSKFCGFSDSNSGIFTKKVSSLGQAKINHASTLFPDFERNSYHHRLEEYKSFDYWREPVDNCYIHSEVINIMSSKWSENKELIEKFWKDLHHEEDCDRYSLITQLYEDKSALKVEHTRPDSSDEEESVNNLVSSMLVKYYLSGDRLRWISSRISSSIAAESLANFLPAVALTLGPKNWHLLKPAFTILATHEEWKIRLAIASSIHELALLLTKEQTEEDLLPVFKSIMEDLDPVRLGALKNMASFLSSLNASARTTFLTRFSDFLGPDFRLREVLVDQLISVLPLFAACDIITFILPFNILVLQDRIAAVRQKAIALACELSLHVYMEDKTTSHDVLRKFTKHLAASLEWRHRQTYANLASALCTSKATDPKKFQQVFYAQLCSMCKDQVVNVRISVARALRDIVLSKSWQVTYLPILKRALEVLSSDEDPDVRELCDTEIS